MLALVVNDIHFTDRPPSSCTDSYLPDLFDLLGHVKRVGELAKIDVEVWAGDIFHYKAPSRTSHELVARVSDLVRARKWPVEVVPGNHDIKFDRVDTLDSQPLGMLFRAGAHRLDGWCGEMLEDHERKEYGMLPLYGVPWIQGYGKGSSPEIDAKVRDAMEDWREQLFKRGWGDQYPLMVTHAPLYPPSRELEFEYYPSKKWQEAMGGAGYVAYGHVHEAHGIWDVEGPSISDKVTFCNVGALSRGSLHESELTREVSVALYDSHKGKFEKVVLPHKPASAVFRLTEAKEFKDAEQSLEQFVAAVGSSTLPVTTTEAVVAKVEGMDIPRKDEILSLTRRLLEEVR